MEFLAAKHGILCFWSFVNCVYFWQQKRKEKRNDVCCAGTKHASIRKQKESIMSKWESLYAATLQAAARRTSAA